MTSIDPSRSTPGEVLVRFLRFGLLAFGGPVAQIAMLRRELVDEERWITPERFNRLLAVYQVLPGPEAHELAVHMGWLRGGRLGALLAGLGFMLPGFVLVLGVAWLYRSVDLTQPWIAAALLGAQLGVLALIVRAAGRLAGHLATEPALLLVAGAAALATLASVPFWAVLPIGAGATVVARRSGSWAVPAVLLALGVVAAILHPPALLPASGPGLVPPPGSAATTPSVLDLFATGLRAGLLTFGGAYTAIPFVREDAVGGGWLTEGQFLDGLALSGVLPAPLIIFGTFVGAVAGGLAGAFAITAGIFLPAFAFAMLLGDRIEAVVERPAFRNALEGVAAAVVGIIAATAIQLAGNLAGRVPELPAGVAIFAGALAILVAGPSRLSAIVAIGGAALGGWLLLGGLP